MPSSWKSCPKTQNFFFFRREVFWVMYVRVVLFRGPLSRSDAPFPPGWNLIPDKQALGQAFWSLFPYIFFNRNIGLQRTACRCASAMHFFAFLFLCVHGAFVSPDKELNLAIRSWYGKVFSKSFVCRREFFNSGFQERFFFFFFFRNVWWKYACVVMRATAMCRRVPDSHVRACASLLQSALHVSCQCKEQLLCHFVHLSVCGHLLPCECEYYLRQCFESSWDSI